jgi:hypothetical protein
LDAKGKKDLWDYFKNKHNLDPEEKRMYSMIQRNMKREDVDIYVGNNKMIIKERKKLFTLEEGTGILNRVSRKVDDTDWG